MTPRIRRTAAFAFAMLALAAVPAIARALRRDGTERCALDGVAVAAGVRVRVVDAAGTSRSFCCVDCARLWTQSQAAPPRAIVVTDEATGAAVRADEAWFVRSAVVACAATGCRIHVFRDEAAARRNAASFRGVVLTGGERPFGPAATAERSK